MSNGLYAPIQRLALTLGAAPTTAPTNATAADGPLSGPEIALALAGLAVLLGWATFRPAPGRLRLADAPPRPTVLHPLAVVALLLAWVLALAAMGRIPAKELQITAMALAQVAFIAASLALARTAFADGLARGLGLTAHKLLPDLARGTAAMLAAMPLTLGLYHLTCLLLPPDLRVVHPLLTLTREFAPFWQALVVLVAVVIGPIAEEIFFRGLLQSLLRQRVGRPWMGIGLTSVVFAIMHSGTPQAMPALLALSLVLGYAYERTGRLTAPIVAHALFNAANIALFMTR